MTSSNASPRARSTARGFSAALGTWTPAALMWAVLLVGGVPSAQAGINVWTKVGPPTGAVATLAIDPTMPDTLYGGGYRGVFKSTDGGSTWAVKAGLSVTVLAVDPATSGTLYAVTDERTDGIGDGVAKSTDGGSTWSTANTGLPLPLDVITVAIDPSTPSTLYVGTRAIVLSNDVGVFKSTDGGGTWSTTGLSRLSTGLDSFFVTALAIDPSTPGTLYAGLATDLFDDIPTGAVFKSTDGGDTWNATGTSLPSPVIALAIDPATPGTLYAGTYGGVFKSSDAGGTWSIANTGLTDTFVNALAVHPATPGTLYAGTGHCDDTGCNGLVFKSTDGGAIWSATGLTNAYVIALAGDPSNPNTLYAGTPFGVFKSTDGGSAWSGTTSSTDYYRSLAIDPTTPGTLYAGTGGVLPVGAGVFTSTDGGGTWAARTGLPAGSEVNALAIDPTTPGMVYAGTNGGVSTLTDGGGTWRATSLTGPDVRALAVAPTTPAILYAAAIENGVFRSTDGGSTWAPVNTGLTDPYVFALAVDPTNPTTLYAGTGDCIDPAFFAGTGYCDEFGGHGRSGLFKSTDGGDTWSIANTGLTDAHVVALAIDPTHPATLYAGTGGYCDELDCHGRSGLFKSTDGGDTWSIANTGLTNPYVVALVIDPSDPNTLYAGTFAPYGLFTGGVFKSTDGGGTWTAFDTGLLYHFATVVAALAIDPTTPRTLYAATNGGVFSIQQVGSCAGDCNDSRNVRVNEIVKLVSIALGTALPAACPHGVLGGAAVDIALLIEAVNNALAGCRFTAQ